MLFRSGTAAVVTICLPKNRKRVSGFWIGYTAVMGILAGLLCISSVSLFSWDGFPFDPRERTGALFGNFIMFEDFTVGVAIPFILLALVLAAIPERTKRKPG